MATTGCSVANHGALAAKVTVAEGAYVVDTYAVGASLRTRPEDPGLAVGFDRRSYVFDLAAVPEPQAGWHYFHAPMPDEPALVLHSETYGLELRTKRSETSLSLGYRATTVMAQIAANQSAYRLIAYQPDAPELTHLFLCRSDWPCE